MTKKITFLGIETSCDETAAAVIRENDKGTADILSNIVSSQIEEHKKFGGVVPELAARAHLENIEYIIDTALKESKISIDELDGVAYADFNGDGYDDIILHPTYTTYRHGGFSSVKMQYELYLYENGSYVFTEINWGGIDPPKVHLARKIIVGDYDNDGDPDFYSANQGLDIPPYSGEFNGFIINNYNINIFRYKCSSFK